MLSFNYFIALIKWTTMEEEEEQKVNFRPDVLLLLWVWEKLLCEPIQLQYNSEARTRPCCHLWVHTAAPEDVLCWLYLRLEF
jgi:hypothetical protein